jgi:hypothetical protein
MACNVDAATCIAWESDTISVAKLEPLEADLVIKARLAARRAIQETIRCVNPLMEDTPMYRRFVVAMLGLGLAFILMPQVSLAVEDHLSQAIEHTRQAIDHGKQG